MHLRGGSGRAVWRHSASNQSPQGRAGAVRAKLQPYRPWWAKLVWVPPSDGTLLSSGHPSVNFPATSGGSSGPKVWSTLLHPPVDCSSTVGARDPVGVGHGGPVLLGLACFLVGLVDFGPWGPLSGHCRHRVGR